MITMTLHPAPSCPLGAAGEQHSATAVWRGESYSATTRRGCVMALARVLKAADCRDLPWQAMRGTVRAMFGPSLYRIAGLTVEESDKTGPRFTKFAERTFAAPAELEGAA